ncbi:Lipoprotein [Pseudomonas syringae pv. maculicola]|nr:Lipoprotein [Pseudomonas syringae pv. maculicola]
MNAARWREFLDKEVTPRFPDGFTAFDAYGQWRDKGAAQPERLSTKVIVILHENTAIAQTSKPSAWPGNG